MARVVEWSYALAMQVDRISKSYDALGGLESKIDMQFFVLALRNLLRAASLVYATAPEPAKPKITSAVEKFEREVPGLITMRDWLEHFDEYQQGTGRMQRKLADPQPPVIWVERRVGGFAMSIRIAGLEALDIDLMPARDAADRLMAALEHAVG